jgi:DDE superfamily endonuclease
MEFLVPLYPQNRQCISCGCKVGSSSQKKSNKNLKHSCCVGLKGQLQIFAHTGIITNQQHHVFCFNCSTKNIATLNIPSVTQNTKPKQYDQLIQSVIEYGKQKIIEENTISVNKKYIKFNDITNEECKYFCGLYKDNINEVSDIVSADNQRTFEFFAICRQGLTQQAAAIIFGYDSKSTISAHFNEILVKLSEYFVPQHLGYTSFTRDIILQQHVPNFFAQLFPNVVGIVDGTYFYCQKSKCFEIQRKTWCDHKKRNLVKMMGIQLPSGKWYDLIGPFYADGDHNDAKIWNYIVEENLGNICDAFDEENDEFLGDRGFRDVDDERFSFFIPLSLKKGQKQLSTIDANVTRKVTRLRNSIERGFGRLKKWKIIDGVINNNLIYKLKNIIRVLGAIENAYYIPLFKESNNDEKDIESIKYNETLENPLQNISPKNWSISSFEEIKSKLPNFDIDDIRQHALGQYALNLAVPYLQHASKIKIKTHEDVQYSNVIRLEGITSRYSKKTNRKKHVVYLQFNENEEEKEIQLNNENFTTCFNKINSYCSCKSGARTVGACAHIIAGLYYLYTKMNNIEIPTESIKSSMLKNNILEVQHKKICNNENNKNNENEITSFNNEKFNDITYNNDNNDDNDNDITYDNDNNNYDNNENNNAENTNNNDDSESYFEQNMNASKRKNNTLRKRRFIEIQN